MLKQSWAFHVLTHRVRLSSLTSYCETYQLSRIDYEIVYISLSAGFWNLTYHCSHLILVGKHVIELEAEWNADGNLFTKAFRFYDKKGVVFYSAKIAVLRKQFFPGQQFNIINRFLRYKVYVQYKVSNKT